MTSCLLMLLAQSELMPSGSEWVRTGLLGGILGWLLFVHLPAKDKQILGLVEKFDASLTACYTMIREEGRMNREASEKRQLAVVGALQAQTIELKSAIESTCNFDPTRHKEVARGH